MIRRIFDFFNRSKIMLAIYLAQSEWRYDRACRKHENEFKRLSSEIEGLNQTIAILNAEISELRGEWNR